MKKLLSIILFSLAGLTALAIDPQGSHLSDENTGSDSGLIVFVAIAISLWLLISAIVGRNKKRKNDSIDKTSTQVNNYKLLHNKTTTVNNVGVSRQGNNVGGNPYVHPTTNRQTATIVSKQRSKTYSDLENELRGRTVRYKDDGTYYYPETTKTIKGILVEKRQHHDDYTTNVDIQFTVDKTGKIKFTRWRTTPHGVGPIIPDDKYESWYDIRFCPEPTSTVDGEYQKKYNWRIRDLYPLYFNIGELA